LTIAPGRHSGRTSNRRERNARIEARLGISLGITLAFVVVEFMAGLMANSLVLMTDAAHNLTDAIALGLSWFALRAQTRPSGAANTFGNHRIGILVALVNSTTLVLISLGVFYEAYRRLLAPPSVRAEPLILVAMAALVVNLATALLIRREDEHDLNVRSAFLHLMGDAASTAAAVVAGIIIYFTGADWLDPAVSVLIGVLILAGAWRIVREATDILLESTPRDVDMAAMVRDMLRVKGVQGIHDLHVWSLSKDLRTMSAHVLTDDVPVSVGSLIQAEINLLLAHKYRISHATLQLECVGCDPGALYCEIDSPMQDRLK
jgi:cobalt-zinc-cadmium efflux system protein